MRDWGVIEVNQLIIQFHELLSKNRKEDHSHVGADIHAGYLFFCKWG